MWFYPLKKLNQLNWQDYIYISMVGHIIVFLFLWLTPYLFKTEKVLIINKKSYGQSLAKISFNANTLKKPIAPQKIIEKQQAIIPAKKPMLKKNVPVKKEIKPKVKENRKIIEPKKEMQKKLVKVLKKEIKVKEPKPEKKKEIIKPAKEIKPEPEEPKELVLNLSEAELELSWMQKLKNDIIDALDRDILEKIEGTVFFSITLEKTGPKIIIEESKNPVYYLALLKEILLKIKYPAAMKQSTIKLVIPGEKNG